MPPRWQLAEAKNRLSQVIHRAVAEGPQVITRHGRETAVVVSIDDYRRLARPAGSLVEFFRDSPLVGVELDLTRSPEPARDVDL